MNKEAENKVIDLVHDPDFLSKLQLAQSDEEALELFHNHGVTEESVQDADFDEELNEDELKAVVGGVVHFPIAPIIGPLMPSTIVNWLLKKARNRNYSGGGSR